MKQQIQVVQKMLLIQKIKIQILDHQILLLTQMSQQNKTVREENKYGYIFL